MRIVFMGTPEFAVPSLESLVNSKYEVVMVVTQPDKPKGRGYKVCCPPVKEYALLKGIPVFQPEKIRDQSAVRKLAETNPDLFVTCAFGQFLTSDVLNIPKYGTVNVHASLLPKYRGAAPINWAIINGEKKTGITTMMTVLKMDAGDILLQEELEIDDDMTAGQLHDRLSLLGADLLIKTIRKIEEGTLERIPQNDSEATFAPRITGTTGRIDWGATARQIHNLVRGTNPWPGAFSFFKGERMRIWKTIIIDETKTTGSKPGTILEITKTGFIVQTGSGLILISEIQCDNSKRLTTCQYVCGHCVIAGDCFGE
ncbi:MAG: methionyl-tRNA formyltransferase [Clostridiaceae bacterium]|nr:methionyl-tRNA formyltransferase [Clostridiaceae bacterium]